MDVYATEEEQIEQIKQWVRKYGATVVITVVIVIAASFGWRYWRNHEENMRYQASSSYESMLINVMGNNHQAATLQAEQIIKDYPRTPYAKLAGLIIAKYAVNQKHYAKAETQLHWVINNARSESIKDIARIRAARVLLAENKTKQALTLLSEIKDPNFAAAIATTKGDIYVAMHDKQAARKAYRTALNHLPKNDATRPLVQMKLDDLATVQPIPKK